MRAQVAEVARHIVHTVHLHAPRDSPENGRAFVIGEIAPRPCAQKDEHFAQRGLGLVVRRFDRLCGLRPFLGRQLQHLSLVRDVSHAHHPIHHAGLDRRPRHGRMLCLLDVLCDRQPAAFLDPFDPKRAVAIRARENNRCRMRAVRIRE